MLHIRQKANNYMKHYSDSGHSIVTQTIGNSRLNGRHHAISKSAAVKQTTHMGMRCGEQENLTSLMGKSLISSVSYLCA